MKQSFLKSAYGKVSLMLILLLTGLCALYMGSANMTLSEFFSGLIRKEGFETESIILYSVRLPRILGGMLAGAALSLSGVLLQTVTNNALASPNIIGVNSGAGLAVIILMYFFPQAVYSTSVVAFIGAFSATAVILYIAGKTGSNGSTVILSGIAVTSILNAGISFISYLDADLLSAYNYFSVGGLSGVRGKELAVPFIIVAAGIALAYILSDKADTLMLGDSMAMSLGVNVKVLRVLCLIISSACAGAAVSFAGLLGFVGLVVPHIARRLVGSSLRQLIPVSVLSGAILMICADLLGRLLIAPSEIPVGIVMAFIGAPFFFWLLIRRKKDA